MGRDKEGKDRKTPGWKDLGRISSGRNPSYRLIWMTIPFWLSKSLSEMSRSEWESLCDGCARCCLIKLEDEDTARIYYTDVACRLLDCESCRCTDYAHRARRVRDCLRITPKRARAWGWLPPTCAYRLVAEGRDLYGWHPLVSGDPETVHQAGVSVRGRVAAGERALPESALERHIVNWPLQVPTPSRRGPSGLASGKPKDKLRPSVRRGKLKEPKGAKRRTKKPKKRR
jgi:hypothetical protein